ncbi:hypothetical protein ACHAWF_000947 [Thalassiosira exigua]
MMTMISPAATSRAVGALAARASSTLARSSSMLASSSNAAIPRPSALASGPVNGSGLRPPSPPLLPAPVISAAPRRCFSSVMPTQGFPQYIIFGPDCALCMKAMLPQFRRAGRDGVSVERRGKLALEMIPRNNTGAGFAWSDKTAIHLSVEEVGLLLSQLPGNEVELAHPVQVPKAADETAATEGERLEKVLTIVPGEGTTLTFKLDFVKDGVGGQAAPGSEGLSVGIVLCATFPPA